MSVAKKVTVKYTGGKPTRKHTETHDVPDVLWTTTEGAKQFQELMCHRANRKIPEQWEHHGRMWPVLILLHINEYVRDVLEAEPSCVRRLEKLKRDAVVQAKRSWQGVSGARPNGEFGRGRETEQPTLRPGKKTR